MTHKVRQRTKVHKKHKHYCDLCRQLTSARYFLLNCFCFPKLEKKNKSVTVYQSVYYRPFVFIFCCFQIWWIWTHFYAVVKLLLLLSSGLQNGHKLLLSFNLPNRLLCSQANSFSFSLGLEKCFALNFSLS